MWPVSLLRLSCSVTIVQEVCQVLLNQEHNLSGNCYYYPHIMDEKTGASDLLKATELVSSRGIESHTTF